MERRLAAIFSTDVQGYSRLMGEDEVAAIHTICVDSKCCHLLERVPQGALAKQNHP